MQYTPKLTLKTAPTVEPVLAAELAAWGGGLSISDPLLTTLLKSAREMVESYLGAGLLTQTWQQFYDINILQEKWWDGVREGPTTDLIVLPRSFAVERWPVISVTSLSFFDEADAATVADPASYYISSSARPPSITVRFGYNWPTIVYRIRDALVIEFIVGYGATAANVPEAIKNAIKALAIFLYEHRGQCDVNEAIAQSGAKSFLKPFRVARI